MIYRIKDLYDRMRLNFVLRDILETPPVQVDEESHVSLISQIREKDILMYLLAAKSFCLWHKPAHIWLLIDGEFHKKSIEMLNIHIPDIAIEPHVNYRSKDCPAGGTWERLLALTTHAQHAYVIQLDADTITLGSIEEVATCISDKRPFTLGSRQGQQIETSAVISRRARESLDKGDTHIQTLSESVLDRFMQGREIRYVRGCSAFTGIPKGAISPDFVVDWAQALEKLVGPRWHEWGTEQFMSNLLIANISNSMVLPHPRYATCPNVSEEHTVLAHMAGFCRFSKHQYARLARTVIRKF